MKLSFPLNYLKTIAYGDKATKQPIGWCVASIWTPPMIPKLAMCDEE